MDRVGRAMGIPGFEKGREIPLSRLWTVAGAGAALLVIAAVAGGLLLGRDAPAVQADEADTYAAAPACASVPAEDVRALMPDAALETSRSGPQANGESSTCVWTSIGSDEGPPRALHVDFTAHFTDKAGEVSGARAAATRLEELAPIGGLEGADRVPELGEGALAWPGSSDRGSAEVVFRRHNMLIEVFYGGRADDQGEAMSYDAARDGAITFAEQVAASL